MQTLGSGKRQEHFRWLAELTDPDIVEDKIAFSRSAFSKIDRRKPFTWPATRKFSEDIKHPKKPSAYRIDDLHQPWQEGEIQHTVRLNFLFSPLSPVILSNSVLWLLKAFINLPSCSFFLYMDRSHSIDQAIVTPT